MNLYDICCVGHLTLDKIVNPKETVYMSGGASFYISHAISKLNSKYILVAGLAESEMEAIDKLREKNIEVKVMASKHSVYFENRYEENQDNRTQRVLAKADPFEIGIMDGIDAKYFHIGALLADDFSVEFVQSLSKRGRISIDCQGYLREVRGTEVFPVDWADKKEVLQYVDVLKANEMEMKVLTGTTDVYEAARMLNKWGVKEVLLTLGCMGSVIYDGNEFMMIPAFQAKDIVDATGCGDTYMAGYLYRRSKGDSMKDAATFAAAMATTKIEDFGPFTGTDEDVYDVIVNRSRKLPDEKILSNLNV